MNEALEPIMMKEPVAKAELEPEPVSESKAVIESEHVTKESCQYDVDDDEEEEEEEDIDPLSGQPFFHIDLARSHVGDARHTYHLTLPVQFTRGLPNKTVPVSLTRGRRSWEMTYLGKNQANLRRFDIRWKEFAKDNKLKVGDACVFELMESSDTALKFKVRVLQGDFPSALLDKQDGTIDHPIVVE